MSFRKHMFCKAYFQWKFLPVCIFQRHHNGCPLENICLTPRIVYRADVTNNKTNEHKYYYGISDTPFKERYENHKTSFRHRSHLTASDLCITRN